MVFDIYKALYRRNNFGQPCVWYCKPSVLGGITIYHGIVGKVITKERIDTNRNTIKECNSRTNAKRKAGYKLLNELKDNTELPVEYNLYSFLDTYLPYDRTTIDGSVLPMLAKVYNNGSKTFSKVPNYISQWKINGLRCFISAETNQGDLFKPVILKFQSREGTYWDSLQDLEDYLLHIIDRDLLNKMIDEHYILDGELYLPGHSVNEINHFVKDSTCKENKLIQYWCYDIAIENILQYKRTEILHDSLGKHIVYFRNKEEHYNNKNRLVVLPDCIIGSDVFALKARDNSLDLGFEGLIMRDPNKEYQYGKRNSTMLKFKKSTDGKFTIVDIYSEGIKRKDVPLIRLRNDINEYTFEVHVGGSFAYQKQILKDKHKYIGKQMYVEYGERSGINKVPFHVKNTYIIDDI